MDQAMWGGLQFQQKGRGRTGWPMLWQPFLLHVGASHGPAMGLAAVDSELADASSSGTLLGFGSIILKSGFIWKQFDGNKLKWVEPDLLTSRKD